MARCMSGRSRSTTPPVGKILENKKIEQVFGFDGVFINRIDVIDRDPNPDDDEDEDGDGDGGDA